MKYCDHLMELFVKIITALSMGTLLFLLIYVGMEGVPLFAAVSPGEFLATAEWYPLDTPGRFGILDMILGSLYVSAAAVVLAIPVGIGCAVFCCFCLNSRLRRLFLSFIDILAGVPSVVFGFIGLMTLVKFFEAWGGLSSGECVLAGSILLAVMILPFIITNCTESMERSRQLYEEVSLNLGVDRWHTISRIILPQSIPAISVSLILAFSRAMGETMAVMMVMGNATLIPSLLGKGETIPTLIALEMGSAAYGSPHYQALYAAALVLLVILILCNLLFYLLRH